MVKKKKKAKTRKGVGKGVKAFLTLLVVAVVTMGLYVAMDQVNKAMIKSKVKDVSLELEAGDAGTGPDQFREPSAVAVDPAGDYYVTDFSNHRVMKFDPSGKLVLSIGKRGKGDGEFEQPSGIWVAQNGDIFVCDTFNHRIQKFDAKGKFLKAWSRSFFGPRSIAGNDRGRVYVSDTGNHKVQAFDESGNFILEWGGFGTADGKFREPVGCVVDPDGSVYVADSDNCRIQKFDPNGKFVAAFKVGTWRGKNDESPYLAFAKGFLYATNASEKWVLKYDPSGKLAAIFQKKGDQKNGGFAMLSGIAVDGQGRVYVVEKSIAKIARFTAP